MRRYRPPCHPNRTFAHGAFCLAITALAAAVLAAACSVPQFGAARLVNAARTAATSPATGPLRVDSRNPRYFTDGSRIIYLTGSHTWANFQNAGMSDPPPVFDYEAYLELLELHQHNFFRLWGWEQAEGSVWESRGPWFAPLPYVRSGPGTALDGKPKFNLDQFDQAYFDRMRARIIAAGQRGMYVSIMLFNGWSVMKEQDPRLGNPWTGHPFNAANNINGVDGDVDDDDSGSDTHTLAIPQVTAYQEAYVRKVIDTVNDLDNVLYEISNESPDSSIAWQYHMIDYVKAYEAARPKQHPVGMTGRFEWDLNDLLDSHADWISPGGIAFRDEPQANDGRKVIVNDTDHLWGIGGDRAWVWKSFTRGLNVIYMDCYDQSFCADLDPNDPVRAGVLANMGYTRAYAQRMNLAAMTPHGELCSSEYCLAHPAAEGAEYLVYLPAGSILGGVFALHGSVSVDLSAAAGELQVEWLNPETGERMQGSSATGGAQRSFTAPFGGDAVLYLYQKTSSAIRNWLYLPLLSSKQSFRPGLRSFA